MKYGNDHFLKYKDIMKIIKEIEDPDIIADLRKTLDNMRAKMFKSEEYLDTILEKDYKDITPQDLMDLMCRMADPEADNSWWSMYMVGNDKISVYVHGIHHNPEPCIELTLDGFHARPRVRRSDGEWLHSIDRDSGTYDFLKVGLQNRYQVDCVIKTTLNMYRVWKLNKHSIESDIRSYPRTWNSKYEFEEFWEGLFRWLIKCKKFDVIEKTNFDYSMISEEAVNLYKSKAASEKFNLDNVKKAS